MNAQKLRCASGEVVAIMCTRCRQSASVARVDAMEYETILALMQCCCGCAVRGCAGVAEGGIYTRRRLCDHHKAQSAAELAAWLDKVRERHKRTAAGDVAAQDGGATESLAEKPLP